MRAALTILFISTAVAVEASPILVSQITPDATGFTYTYMLESDTPGQQIVELILTGLSSYDDASVTWPDGWVAAMPFLPDLIAWVAIDPAAAAGFGAPVEGFSFHSSRGPGTSDYIALYAEEDATGSLVGFGTVAAPAASAAVPEPGTLTLMLGGGLIAQAVRRRRRGSAARQP